MMPGNPGTTRPRIYLAGPGVFRTAASGEDARAHGARLKALCAAAGLDGLYPLDNEISASTPQATARTIYDANVARIESSDAVIADLQPFRGPNMDPGTAWEIGYAAARKLPLFLYTADPRTLLTRTTESHALVPSPRRDSLMDASGMCVEDFGLVENLMIAARASQIYGRAEDAIAACARHFSRQDS